MLQQKKQNTGPGEKKPTTSSNNNLSPSNHGDVIERKTGRIEANRLLREHDTHRERECNTMQQQQ